MPEILCFDIGGSTIKAATATNPDAITVIGRTPTPLHDFAAFSNAIATFAKTSGVATTTSISISITGVIDPATGVIKCANIPCIDGTNLAETLRSRLARPVTIANDADCFALAEATSGAGRGHAIVFGAILGTGVGGGLVIDGRLVTGAGGFAGEWGHAPIAATEAGTPPVAIPKIPCGCRQIGCVDTIGAARGMERLHLHLHGETATSHDIIAAWETGDPTAERTIAVQLDLLSAPLALVINVVGASIVPVGGGLANSQKFIAALDRMTRSRILRLTKSPIVVPGTCRIEPGLIGAASLGFSR